MFTRTLARLFLESLEERMCLSTVAYWRFEEGVPDTPAQGANSVLDSSGNNLHGTPENGPFYRADVKDDPIPQTGQANDLSMQFDGSNQRVVLADNTTLALTKSLTVEAYIQRTGPQGWLGQILFRGDDQIAHDPYYLAIYGDDLYFHVENAAGQQANLSFPLPKLHQWYHVAGTLDDASGVMKLYVDGSIVATTVTAIRPFGALDPTKKPGLGIGGLQADSTYCCQFFHGFIDEVRVSDEALSAKQFLNASANLIVNGDFELGNVRFGTQHVYSPGNTQPEGTYDVLSDPKLSHPSAPSYGDHTTGSGLMMAVNGAVVPNKLVWIKNLRVDPNTPYIFSIWVSNWSATQSNPAELEFSFNDVSIGTFDSPTTSGIWVRFATGWNSHAVDRLTIKITNRELAGFGNDFALDDISLIKNPSGAPIPGAPDGVAALGTLDLVGGENESGSPRIVNNRIDIGAVAVQASGAPMPADAPQATAARPAEARPVLGARSGSPDPAVFTDLNVVFGAGPDPAVLTDLNVVFGAGLLTPPFSELENMT